ncbi:putative peptidyl-tRNA hydrolase PTRHD1 [Ischnura elegans]|uniref:putative peptidyl-tRNA hydrolase PTRHD1 n=1 Tax=Ischnura elegans TaxID=197161 RepID=UPI001ED88E9D|nr:putative peptidyl-tRNA hydrolase PTRHD1 [Ischnura elegans]
MAQAKNLVQYVVVRGDLATALKWPYGAIIAQACHACVAVTHLFYEDQNTKDYLSDLDNMHKVVLQAPNEESLQQLAKTLKEGGIDHKVWVEQPENYPTCVVTKPYPKAEIQKFFKKFQLFKG